MSFQQIKRDARMKAATVPGLLSILIVDDERFDRARIRRICEAMEFESLITEVSTLQALGAALNNDKFDLVFLDFNLPDGDGLLVLDAIQFSETNRFASIIMVTGDDDVDVAIAAMTNGCGDFIKKENVSHDSIRRATVNVLQKAALNRGLENETHLRTNIEAVLDQFITQCVEEFQPMLFNVMRNVRALQAARLDEQKYSVAVNKIEKSCERLFDFVSDIEDAERRRDALLYLGSTDASMAIAAHPTEEKAGRTSLFGRNLK